MKDKNGLPRFDIGLTLAGAISAGAYTAGVIDFLIEALDAWEKAKTEKALEAPQHSVNLRVISGASAGSITGAILGGCLKYDFPHVRLNDPAGKETNPLYDSWVERIDISKLLETRDLEKNPEPVSLLDSSSLVDIAERAMNYGAGVPALARPYLDDPLRFIFTLTNLRGVPFKETLTGANYPHAMTMHGDVMRFALQGLGSYNGNPLPRANDYALSYPPKTEKWPDAEWQRFAMTSLASGAFPVGLSPRELTRKTSDYLNLPVVVPGTNQVTDISPAWSKVNPDPGPEFSFVNVDGGTINNEPLEYARIELAGGDPTARNERDGEKADRALIMIDPFVGPEEPGPKTMKEVTLLGSLAKTFSSLVDQARFNPGDIALAQDESKYSRFLIAPIRSVKKEDPASSGTSIACGSLGGFGGFLDKEFRRHDYFLGRRNCQRFLIDHFTLPEENGLFANWTAGQKECYRTFAPSGYRGAMRSELPIIPVMRSINSRLDQNAEEKEPDWPRNGFDPDTLEDPVKERLDGLFDGMTDQNTEISGFSRFLLSLGWQFFAKPKVADYVLNAIKSGLIKHDLLTPVASEPGGGEGDGGLI